MYAELVLKELLTTLEDDFALFVHGDVVRGFDVVQLSAQVVATRVPTLARALIAGMQAAVLQHGAPTGSACSWLREVPHA